MALAFSGPAGAGPLFVDRAASLTDAPVYAGDWEHSVGGGVAILDSNADRRPDLFVAGGTNPATLWVNERSAGGDITLREGEVAQIAGVTGAYPLDIDGDG